MPLCGLLGELVKKPAYKLFGGKGPEMVPVYDCSIYFAELLREYPSSCTKPKPGKGPRSAKLV